jgi:nucleotide-binding universal stress UspA family protein
MVTLHAHPAAALIDRSQDAGMIVVGSRGHSAVAGLLGSVSVAVSAHACCPVVVVRGQSHATQPVVAGVDGVGGRLAGAAARAEQATGRGVPLRNPAAALSAASNTAQLMVVGSRGHGVVRSLLPGSVSQHLLRHSSCSVAVVHTPEP